MVGRLGDLIDDGGGLNAYCSKCGRGLDCDVYDLAIWLGRRQPYVRTRLPLRCQRCGSVEIHYTVSTETRPLPDARRLPPTNFRSSRTEAERAALMLVFPRKP